MCNIWSWSSVPKYGNFENQSISQKLNLDFAPLGENESISETSGILASDQVSYPNTSMEILKINDLKLQFCCHRSSCSHLIQNCLAEYICSLDYSWQISPNQSYCILFNLDPIPSQYYVYLLPLGMTSRKPCITQVWVPPPPPSPAGFERNPKKESCPQGCSF